MFEPCKAFGGWPLRGSVSALVLAACLSVALAQPEGMIAFITPEGQLAVVAPDGSDAEVLTAGAQRFQFPAWSPDGTALAVIGSDGAGGFVRVYAFGEGAWEEIELYRSAREPPFYLYWSPDGRTVSFLANHPQDGIALHLASLPERSERVLATGSPFYWQWTADSRRLLLHIGFSGPGARLGFTRAGEDTLEENLDAPGFFQAPAISPSERFIAYGHAGPGGLGEVVLGSMEAGQEGEEVRREVRHQGLVALSFSPAEDLLAIMSPAEDALTFTGPLSLLDAETGLLEVLVDDLVLAFFWSPDGRYIAYFTVTGRGGSRVAGAGATTVQRAPLLFDLRLVEVASGEIRTLATFPPSGLFLQQFLPFFDQYALSHSLWSPASDALVVPMLDADGRSQVVVVPLEGDLEPIVEGGNAFWNRR